MDKKIVSSSYCEKDIFDGMCFRDRIGSLSAKHEALKKIIKMEHRLSSQLMGNTSCQLNDCIKPQPASSNDTQDPKDFFSRQFEDLTAELHEIRKTLSHVEMEHFSTLRTMPATSGLLHSLDDCAILSSQIQPTENLIQQQSLKSAASNLLMFLTLKRNLLVEELRDKASSFPRISKLPSLSSQCHLKCSSSFSNEDGEVFKTRCDIADNFVDDQVFGIFDKAVRKTRSVDNLVKEEFDTPTILPIDKQCKELMNLNSNSSPVIIQQDPSDDSHRLSQKEIERSVASSKNLQNTDFEPFYQPVKHNDEIDPKLLAEIEEFEKMAAQYVKDHQP